MNYFKEEEFDSPDLKGSGKNMTLELRRMLDDAREFAGVLFRINSGYRTTSHNRKVGGSETSSHLNGTAVDIHCITSKDRLRIISGLIDAGFVRIGVAKTFIHADVDSKPNACWVY